MYYVYPYLNINVIVLYIVTNTSKAERDLLTQ